MGRWVGRGGKKPSLFLLLRVEEINYAETLVLPSSPCAGSVVWALIPLGVPVAHGS